MIDTIMCVCNMLSAERIVFAQLSVPVSHCCIVLPITGFIRHIVIASVVDSLVCLIVQRQSFNFHNQLSMANNFHDMLFAYITPFVGASASLVLGPQ